jgi:hypothetical protein
MKTKYTTLKPSAIGTFAATLLAVSSQISAADEDYPIWAGHFKEAYSGASQQTDGSTSGSNTTSRAQDALIWAGHFERAYDGSSQASSVVTRPEPGKALLWAKQFPQAYPPADEQVEVVGAEIAMDQ